MAGMSIDRDYSLDKWFPAEDDGRTTGPVLSQNRAGFVARSRRLF